MPTITIHGFPDSERPNYTGLLFKKKIKKQDKTKTKKKKKKLVLIKKFIKLFYLIN